MKNVEIKIPVERLVEKEFKGKDGKFSLKGINVGEKFIRLVYPQGTVLDDKVIVGHLFPRKYKNKAGVEFSEIAIYVDNGTPVEENE